MMGSLIVAMSTNDVIGRDGGLPWHLPADLRHFRQTTMGHHLIVGRRTWEEVGKPLPGRDMVVVTRNPVFSVPDVRVAHSLEEALELARDDDEPFVGGGAQIYRLALQRELVDRLYVTRVHVEVVGDTHFPPVEWERWRLVSEQFRPPDERNIHALSFLIYERDH